MKKESGNVLLIDNATCHPKVKCENVNIQQIYYSLRIWVLYIYIFKSHYRRFLTQTLILNVEDADSSYALARSVSVLDAVNCIGLAVKKIKAGTVKKCFAEGEFGASYVADNLEEAI
jgi:hypothetical protein